MSSGGALRILIVDDRAEMAEMIADELCERGYDGVATASGRDAIDILKTQHIDALVTDVRMPEIDGFQVLEASHALDPSRPVILMTAFGAVDDESRALAAGACHYLAKPFRLDALAKALEDALRGR